MATTSHSLLQSVEQFYQIIETYVSSHPEIAALMWGSVKLAFMHTIKSKYYRHKNDAKQVNLDKTSLDENKWNALLERLSHYDYAAAFKSARGKRHNGTAEWIFQTSEFESWYGNDASVILHVVGKIGSGKTVLTASIVDRLIRLRQQSLQAIAFFFVRFDDPPSQQSECITRSIVRQLFNHGSSDGEILRFLESSSDQFFDNDSLLALWSERIRSFKDFFLVLDGFDECALADRKAILSSISILSKACQKTTRVKVLVSSRISVKEEIDQANLTVIRMAIDVQNISEDLTKYAEEILKDRISTREMVLGDGNLYSDILQAVGVGGEGMYARVHVPVFPVYSI
ncbi:Vegetative incompatibility protein HET-E-1 [Colletotrichum siamense]|nr:Vegetative incompatibility protein HET-E-1 [Colletotrichum siamense]